VIILLFAIKVPEEDLVTAIEGHATNNLLILVFL